MPRVAQLGSGAAALQPCVWGTVIAQPWQLCPGPQASRSLQGAFGFVLKCVLCSNTHNTKLAARLVEGIHAAVQLALPLSSRTSCLSSRPGLSTNSSGPAPSPGSLYELGCSGDLMSGTVQDLAFMTGLSNLAHACPTLWEFLPFLSVCAHLSSVGAWVAATFRP